MPAANLHHAALTVTDIDASVAWYCDLFGFVELMRDEHADESGGYAIVVGQADFSQAIVLNSHPANKGEGFDPTRTGLDHIGFTVPNRDVMVEWEARLKEKGVTYSPITDHDWGSSLNFRDPDNMQLQFIAFAG